MPASLKQIRLGDYANVISGYAFNSAVFTSAGVPVIKIANIRDRAIVFDPDNPEFVPHEICETLPSKYRVKTNDVLVSLTGSHMTQPNSVVGRVARYNERFTSILNQRAGKVVIRNEKVLHYGYLYYLLSTNAARQEIALLAHGAANQANVAPKDIEKLKFFILRKSVQERVGAVLISYDDLIENNKRRLALLEKVAEEIYREWFVRFRFPNHEKTKRRKGIPEGWNPTPSNKAIRIMGGGTPKTEKSEYWDGEIPFFTPGDAGEEFYVLSTERTITQKGLDKCNSRLYPKDTIFITARGTVGKICLAYRPMAMNQTCYALSPIKTTESYFHFLSMRNAISYIKGVSKSGVFDNIIVDTFKIIPILLPPEGLIKRFNELVAPVFNEIGSLLEQNELLRYTRDLLLPRLISGKLSVENRDIQFPPSMIEDLNVTNDVDHA